MTTSPAREEAEIIAKACLFMNEWISKTENISAAEQIVVDAYLLAKKNFLVKIDTLVVLFIAHEKNENDKVDA
jgi:hypothetical protein